MEELSSIVRLWFMLTSGQDRPIGESETKGKGEFWLCIWIRGR
jgi:hypothetical protein